MQELAHTCHYRCQHHCQHPPSWEKVFHHRSGALVTFPPWLQRKTKMKKGKKKGVKTTTTTTTTSLISISSLISPISLTKKQRKKQRKTTTSNTHHRSNLLSPYFLLPLPLPALSFQSGQRSGNLHRAVLREMDRPDMQIQNHRAGIGTRRSGPEILVRSRMESKNRKQSVVRGGRRAGEQRKLAHFFSFFLSFFFEGILLTYLEWHSFPKALFRSGHLCDNMGSTRSHGLPCISVTQNICHTSDASSA